MPTDSLKKICDTLQELHGTSAELQRLIYDFLAAKSDTFPQDELSEFSKIARHYQATNRQTEAHIQFTCSYIGQGARKG